MPLTFSFYGAEDVAGSPSQSRVISEVVPSIPPFPPRLPQPLSSQLSETPQSPTMPPDELVLKHGRKKLQ